MEDSEKVRGFNVSKARGYGVTVLIFEAELERGTGQLKELATRPAGTWAELAALAAQYSVPRKHWSIDTEARESLGPEPGSS